MSHFYAHATYATEPAAALAAAQRAMLAAGNAPSAWAPFVAIGD
jgi:CHAT domain-containing protein